ncbi:septum formation initiator [Leptospira yasudae]|uniref:Septum formation initiator n=1 Tax=Leptospira yasudae TaxID=2202201 RepID=A0A5F2ANR8_9LEPT|nr:MULTISPECIES: septum formation initiator family protein [Leptospira]MBW0434362.1 septum formation initiator family protein [Leptospira yasudae]MCG6168235.1 septum formation initiator family protein [Leptospira sanjuanensis]MCG6193652.1 septum formation initiator family protein [Leptospira sanjuanensis]RHX80073.1 septum formation initiator [Leptospira yasudae]RHX93983.1 septum formation initiator [Leptospira yasudae]
MTSLSTKVFWFSCFLAGLFYFIVLGESGIVVRSQLEETLASLQLDVERLAYENRQLEEKQKILKNDQAALEREARRFYLLSENAHIVKFREISNSSELKPILASRLNAFRPGKQFPVPPIHFIRIFYAIFASFTCIGVFIKMRKKKLDFTNY